MKIVHTSDWHMGLRLGFIDRTPDIARAIADVARITRECEADVLLVCGDLFDGNTRTDVVRYWMEHLGDTVGDFLRGGGTVLALTGNHDNENLAQALRQTMALAAPEKHTRGGRLAPGRLYLFSGPTFFRLADRNEPGHEVQFVIMPWPTIARYLSEKAQRFTSQEERDGALKAEFKRVLNTVAADPAFDLWKQTVLAAHVPASGALVRDDMTVGATGEVVLEDDELPTGYAYVALGDVHRPQELMKLSHVRYCGSIDRMDLGEAGEDKGVLIVDVGPEGRRGEPRWAPLDPTPIYQVDIDDPDTDLPGLAEQFPDHEKALVKLSIRYQPGRHNLPDLLASLQKIFPRCYSREFEEITAAGNGAVDAGNDATNDLAHGHGSTQPVVETVRAFLTERLAGDARREEIIRLSDDLMEQLV